MKSTLKILDALYKQLGTGTINITGEKYIGDIPSGNQKENISLKSLANPIEYLQNGFLNLNIYVPETKSGRPNLKRFDEIVEQVVPLVDNVYYDGVSFQIDDDKGVFKDQNNDKMYFYNLRLTFQTQ